MTNEHDPRWADEVAAYALGALEPAEAAELEAHLESCERCRAELRWLGPAVQGLPESVERLRPPRRLRESVMAEVRADAKRGRAGEHEAEGGFRLRGGWFGRLRSGAYGWKPAAALAALALVVVALAGYQLGSGGNDGGGGSGTTIVSGEAPGVVAKMVPEGDGGRLQLSNVNGLPEDRVLEAWVQREGEVEAVAALFVPDHEGRAATTIPDMEGVEVVMVTHEPQGGSESPTSEALVTMRVPQ